MTTKRFLGVRLALLMGLACVGCGTVPDNSGDAGDINPVTPVQPVEPDPEKPDPKPDPDPVTPSKPSVPTCKRHTYGGWEKVDGKDARVCTVCGNVENKVNVSAVKDATTVTADMRTALNLSLLKKITMYNAGTVDPISNYDRDIDLIEALNAESLRIDLSIGKGDGGRNYTGGTNLVTGNGADISTYKYDFTQLDRIVKLLDGKDVLPYLDWCYVPTPLQADGNWKKVNTGLPNWKEAWSEVYYQYAKHYVDLGIQVGYHEILNEPDMFEINDGVWGGMFMDREQFYSGLHNELYELGAKAIRRADPYTAIGGPAFALQSNKDTGFLQYVKDHNVPLDFYSFHAYQNLDNLNYTLDLFSQDYAFDFLKTAFHINEYSWLPGDEAGKGDSSEFNTYKGAEKTLTAIMDVVERTDVQWAHWAQFMESTVGADPYGLISRNGHVKAAYNALKMYDDMPVWRYDVSGLPNGLKAVFSANDTKMGYLVWNTTGTEQKVTLKVDNPAFDIATRRVYRIDGSHGSYYENAKNEHLTAEKTVGAVSLTDKVWSGSIPANGVVYITLNKDGYDDFKAWAERTTSFATDLKTTYYYWERNTSLDKVRAGTASYSHFDRNSWTMYLSNGAEDFGVAEASVLAKNLPEKFKVSFKTEGELKQMDNNSALMFRIDFVDEKTRDYTKSVLFYKMYDASRGSGWNWGTRQAPNELVKFDGEVFDIDLSKYAPAGWNAKTGKAEISYVMQNTGKSTRAAIRLYE